MGKLYSLTGILEVTADDCMDALSSSISDYEDAVVERWSQGNIWIMRNVPGKHCIHYRERSG